MVHTTLYMNFFTAITTFCFVGITILTYYIFIYAIRLFIGVMPISTEIALPMPITGIALNTTSINIIIFNYLTAASAYCITREITVITLFII
jgi:hypothetical protein